MRSTPSTSTEARRLVLIRLLAAAIAVIVALDVADVRAPGLALIGVPFVAAAIGLRHGGQPATTLLLLWSMLFVVVGVSWAAGDIGNSFEAGWGDSLFGYVATPLAVWISALLVAHEVHLRAGKRQSPAPAS